MYYKFSLKHYYYYFRMYFNKYYYLKKEKKKEQDIHFANSRLTEHPESNG